MAKKPIKVSARAHPPPAETRRKQEADRQARAPAVGLTVRIEVNLPATGDQQTYDRIFESIRKNLIDAD